MEGSNCSIFFGRSDHPTKGAEESEGSLRSDRLYLTPTELFYIRSHFPTRTWTAPPINHASMVRSGVRLP